MTQTRTHARTHKHTNYMIFTGGSFRQFLWQIVKELQSPLLPILMACPSSAVGINKGKYILVPGSLTFPEEKLLQFFGQLLGVIIRADIPIGLDIMPYFWRSLLGKELTLDDLREADIVTYTLTEKILQVRCVSCPADTGVGKFLFRDLVWWQRGKFLCHAHM